MINLDNREIEVVCPKCKFYNPIFLKQVRVRDVIICRGCKSNIQLEDYMNQYRKIERDIRRTIAQLRQTMKGFSNITIKL